MSENKKSTFTFIIDKDLKEAFKQKCKEKDDEASKVIRRFIKDYIEENKNE